MKFNASACPLWVYKFFPFMRWWPMVDKASSRDDIIGESVRATTPETRTAPARVNANSRKSAPVSPPWMPIGV